MWAKRRQRSGDEPTFAALTVGDRADAWASAGFHIDDDGICRVGTVRLGLAGRGSGSTAGPSTTSTWTRSTGFPHRDRGAARGGSRPPERRPLHRPPRGRHAGHGPDGGRLEESGLEARRTRRDERLETPPPDVLSDRRADSRGHRPGGAPGRRAGPAVRPRRHVRRPRCHGCLLGDAPGPVLRRRAGGPPDRHPPPRPLRVSRGDRLHEPRATSSATERMTWGSSAFCVHSKSTRCRRGPMTGRRRSPSRRRPGARAHRPRRDGVNRPAPSSAAPESTSAPPSGDQLASVASSSSGVSSSNSEPSAVRMTSW